MKLYCRWTHKRSRLAPVSLALSMLMACSVALAQEKTTADTSKRPEVEKGRVVASVHSAAKPEQSYALYVPTNYAPERLWPIIYVFDPAAKGSRPLELMKAAAENYGYLLAGSNNSRNGAVNIEHEAAQEMWNDTHRWLSIDDRRAYFAGFSGGARVAAELAQRCKCAQGVFLNSGGFGVSSPPSGKPAFAVFAMAGMTDFNYGELVELDAQLESLGFRHFFQRFDGRHEWAPADVWQQALAWSALLEMKDSLRARDSGMINAEMTQAAGRLRQREDAGELYFAVGEYRAVVAAFDGLADTSILKERLRSIADNPAVRAGAKEEKAEIEKQQSIQGDILGKMEAVRESGGEQAAHFAEASSRVRDLTADARKERRPDRRRVLERTLGGVFVGAMETGSSLMEQGQASTAAFYFELAALAHPDWAWPHLSLARCHVLTGDKKAAFRDFKHAREAGATAAEVTEFVKADAKLSGLIESPEYEKAVGEPSH